MSNLIAEYQSLLAADESLSTLDRAVDLAHRVAQGGRINGHQRWPSLSDSLTPEGLVPPKASARRFLEVTDLLKSLPQRAESPQVPEAQYSLLMDTLLLVFHQAYFSLLPKIPPYRKALLKAMDVFADKVPNLADRFQAKGLIHLERGEVKQAAQAFSAALAATPSDQHDFMTRLQMLWALLIEHDRLQDAFNCLKQASPRVTRLDYDEFQGLLEQTFNVARKLKH